MALGVPSSSPAVVIKEIDASTSIRTASTTIGGTVGDFRWGPVGVPMTVATETELVSTFAAPDEANSVEFHSAAYYLRYADNLKVVRTTDANAKNAYDADSATAPAIGNSMEWDAQESTLAGANHTFIAKYPGALGTGLTISVCPADETTFDGWAYKSEFDTFPGTSTSATAEGATNDEVHVAVVDVNGNFGSKGAVLETFPHVSLATDAKTPDGSTNYIKNVVNTGSAYVWMAGFGTAGSRFDADAGSALASGTNYLTTPAAILTIDLTGGVNQNANTTGSVATAFDALEDEDTVPVDILFANAMSARVDQVTVTNDITATAVARKDCIAVASPARSDVVGVASPATMVTNTMLTAKDMTYGSYLVVDNNFLKVYDKYNDKYIMVPAASSTAGIMAATDNNAAPWVSPAGTRRGNYLGITSLAYSPTKAQRDTLYKGGVNPIANIPGQGVMLYGDKTHMNRPSAFDRINVRRLFTSLEKAIGEFAKASLFELNDEFTRAEFVNNVEPLLREVKGRRGITDFKVVCDETNNTASVIDRNEFVATLFIKPARSINFITLNFVATRTGADFEEVVGI
jgi:phage tail sheath protein FI